VLRVEAIDLDLELNGKVTYLLEMTSADVGHFLIDRLTGDVTLARYVESYSLREDFKLAISHITINW